MVSETEAALARFQRNMRNAQDLDREASGLIAQAEALQRNFENPAPDRIPPDPELTAIEIASLRERAAALIERADGIQSRLYKTPTEEMQRHVKEWADRKPGDRERDDRSER